MSRFSGASRFGAVLSAALVLCTATVASATPSLVTSRGTLAGDDFFDWGQLGGAFTSPANPSGILSNSGTVTGTISDSSGAMERRDQSTGGWNGNFAPGDRLIWNQSGGLLTIDFGTSVAAVGAQIQRNNFGGFLGSITAFDSSLTQIATFSANGNSTSSGDNSAIFLGIATTLGDSLISRVVFNVDNAAVSFSINQLDIVKATPQPVPEPGTLAIFGLGLAGLCVARRRRAV